MIKIGIKGGPGEKIMKESDEGGGGRDQTKKLD